MSRPLPAEGSDGTLSRGRNGRVPSEFGPDYEGYIGRYWIGTAEANSRIKVDELGAAVTMARLRMTIGNRKSEIAVIVGFGAAYEIDSQRNATPTRSEDRAE
jgi:hypothetical protein